MSNYYVSSGVTSTGVTLFYNDHLYVSSGGVASDTTVNYDCYLLVSEGGTADVIHVNSRGVLEVYSGGTATNIDWTPCEGTLYIYPGAQATFASSYTGVYYGSSGYLLGSAEVWDSSRIGSDWRVCVMNGGIASNTYVEYGDLEIYSGGVASSISMNWYGRCSVYSGGSADDVSVGDRGDMIVASGGTATNITANGTLYVREGASADKIKVNGTLYVNSGGTATEIDWTPCVGGLSIADGAHVTFTSEYHGVYYGEYGQSKSNAATMENMNLASGSSMFVMADGVANRITIGAYGAEMIICSGGVANDATGNGGYIRVSSGGIANNAMINANCYFSVSSGGTANNTTVNQYGHLVVSSGGTAAGASVNNDGNIQVSSGGSANDVRIDSGGTLYVSSGGTATNIDWTPSVGHVQVYEGGTATFVSSYSGVYYGSAEQLVSNAATLDGIDLGSGDKMCVMSGGTATDAKIRSSANMWVYSGGVARDVEVKSGGHLYISSGGVARDVEVGSSGYLYVYSGGTLNGVDLYSYGYIELYGKLTGQIYFGWGGIAFYEGSVLDFDLTQTTAGAGALVNGLSSVLGQQFLCTLTVSDTQANGKYSLASYVYDFDKTISVVNTSGEVLGTLTVDGETQEINGEKYALTRDEFGDLTVTVGDPLPPNGPEEPFNNDLVYKNKTVNENVTEAYGTHLTEAGQEVRLDRIGTVDEEGKHNSLTKETDTADYAKIVLEKGAKLSFHAEANAATTFTVYSLSENKGKYSLKKLQTLKLADKDKDGVFTADSAKPVDLQDAGEYYVSMQLAGKKADGALYNVSLSGADKTKFFLDDDNGENNWLYDSKKKEWNEKVTLSDAFGLNRFVSAVQIDTDPDTVISHKVGETTYTNFVGFGDAMDIRKVELFTAAKLSFDVDLVGGQGKLFLYAIDDKGKIKTVTNQAFKESGTTKKAVVLESGVYYLAMQSTNAKKGDEVYYNIAISDQSAFFTDGDTHVNDYDSKKKAVDPEVDTYTATLETGKALQVDTVLPADSAIVIDYKGFTNFVGYGDESDMVKIDAAAGDSVSLKITAMDAVTLSVYGLKNGKVTALKSVKLKAAGDATLDYKFQEKDGTAFYVGVESPNAKKGGAAWYNIDVVSFNAAPAASLDFAAADALAMTDSLSFGSCGTDVLADASAASALADLDDKSSWQSLLA